MAPRNRSAPLPTGLRCLFELVAIYTRLVFGATLIFAALCVLLEQFANRIS
jgi:hypothetical protein